jgi:protein SCO1
MVRRLSRPIAELLLATALSLGVPHPGVTGSAVTIGGPFTLQTPDGTTVTDQTYRGKWLLVYFGYTFCPTTCPTTLMDIATVLDKLGDEAARIQPIFITVDPQRDTPEVMRQYTQSFDPRIIGLSGDQQQIAAVAQAYGVYYTHRKIGPGAEDYVIDHSSYIYLMGPLGGFERGFDADAPTDELTQAVRDLIHRPTSESAIDQHRAW